MASDGFRAAPQRLGQTDAAVAAPAEPRIHGGDCRHDAAASKQVSDLIFSPGRKKTRKSRSMAS